MAPPDMPAALYAKAVDAYCTGEPFGAAAQRAGYATVLRMTRDEWRNYICCVLTVREELIKENRPQRGAKCGVKELDLVFGMAISVVRSAQSGNSGMTTSFSSLS